MLIAKLVPRFRQKIQSKKLYSTLHRVFSSDTLPDTFVKKAELNIPKKLQAVFDNLGRYDNEYKKPLEMLYQTGEKKFDFVLESFGHSYYSYCNKEFIKSVNKLSENELKQTVDEVVNLYRTLPKVNYGNGEILREASASDTAKFIILKANKPETYTYLINNPDKEMVLQFLNKATGANNYFKNSAFETLTIPQIRQVAGLGTKNTLSINDQDLINEGWSVINDYVSSSDQVISDAQKTKILSRYLSHSEITEPFTAFRGERDTGMFNFVKLDKKLALKTKFNVLKNIFRAKKIQVHNYTGNYETFWDKKINLYEYIMGKKELTLADAMQVAKYGNSNYRNQIIELIKQTQIKDSRFKSLTFDSGMSQGWVGGAKSYSKNTGILQNITVTEGLEGMYSPISNDQAEFILNNKDKILTFQDVIYDVEKDLFKISSTISK